MKAVGLDPAVYGTPTMRRTKASLIYRRTKNLRAAARPYEAGEHFSIPEIEVDDALEMAEQT